MTIGTKLLICGPKAGKLLVALNEQSSCAHSWINIYMIQCSSNDFLRPLAIGMWYSCFFSFYIGLFLILCTWENSSFAKEEGLHHKMYKIKLFHCCDVVPNLVVEIEIFNFGLFVCLLVCLYLAFCQFRKRKMVQLWFQKLFWNQGCDVVSNLVVEIAIYNFDLFTPL